MNHIPIRPAALALLAILVWAEGHSLRAQEHASKPKKKPPAPVFSLTFSPAGHWLAAAGGRSQTTGPLVVWNVTDWKPHLIRIEDRGISQIVFSADGKKLAYTTGEIAVLMNVANWKEINRWRAHETRAYSIAFSPDGSRLATSAAAGTIKIWNAQNAGEIKSIQAHKGHVYQVAFSPDGKRLLSGGEDGAAKLWDTESWNVKQTFEPNDLIVRRVRWSKDGRFFLTSRWDGYVRIRDTSDAKLRGYTQGGGNWADLTSDNRLLVTTGRQNAAYVHRVSLDSPTAEQEQRIRKLIAQFKDDDYQVREEAQNEIAKFGMIAVPILREFAESSDAEVRIRTRRLRRKLMSPEPVTKLENHQGDVEVVCFSPDGKRIATASRGGDVRIWDATTFQEQKTLRLPVGEPGEERTLP